MNRKGLRILMYHRFPDASGLDLQCRHLRQCYRLMSLSEAAASFEENKPLAPNSVSVTVDDGYRDFYEVAYPVFSAHQIPVTAYLVTDFLDGKVWLWLDQVRYAFLNTPRRQFQMELPGGMALKFSLGSEEERRIANQKTLEALKLVCNDDRLRAVSLLAELLEVQIPNRPPRGAEPLAWDEVRGMAQSGVEFGAHTRRHPVLSRVTSRSELTDEIAGSKRRLEEVLGTRVRHFCYPNGLRRDISEETVEAVRQAGYHTAVTTEAGLNRKGDDPFWLRRIGVEPGYAPEYFQQCAAGFHL
jgi:peptidoglycan/xylan/chitin deacetylase (PgdA/CDA1 family)